MKIIAPHLTLLTKLIVSNVWLLEYRDKKLLIDTGHFLERHWLFLSLWTAGVRKAGDLSGIILTHRHSDHAGNAGWLKKKFQCPVFCHEQEAAYLSGLKKPPLMARGINPLLLELLCHAEDLFPAQCLIEDVFTRGSWKWGFEVMPVEGHTEGSIMLFHHPTRTLFSGDAILSGPPPLRLFEKISLARKAFSYDVNLCHNRVKKYLKQIPPTRFLCCGHGPSVAKKANKKLKAMLHRP